MRCFYIEVYGRKHKYRTLEDAKIAAELIFQKTGIVVGIT